MLFNSLQFLLFFIVVTTGYFVIKHPYRWAWLLLASCYFYMAFVPKYILILGFTIVVDYFAGIFIENSQGRTRKIGLYASIAANVGILAVFKYWNWLSDNLNYVENLLGLSDYPVPYLRILLPIGLSFHTFQALSYNFEVYRGRVKAERHFGIYALYVMFYPQLVAGPIERPQNVLHQFKEKHKWDGERALQGAQLMAWGFFKKVAIADVLATVVNIVYDKPEAHTGIQFYIATFAFAFQIYCDFSGYSDIALGAAQVMGFELMKNFNRPYFSKSIAEFWTRWHISLSTWFRDYVYIPLGGNRVSKSKYYFNLFITFLLSGLWHGASWNFVIWGGINGLYLITQASTQKYTMAAWHAWGVSPHNYFRKSVSFLSTFLLICFTWIFFRASNFSQAMLIIKGVFDFDSLWISLSDPTLYKLEQSSYFWLKAGFGLSLLLYIEWVQRTYSIRKLLMPHPTLRAVLFGFLVLGTLVLGNFEDVGQFIYFQF